MTLKEYLTNLFLTKDGEREDFTPFNLVNKLRRDFHEEMKTLVCDVFDKKEYDTELSLYLMDNPIKGLSQIFYDKGYYDSYIDGQSNLINTPSEEPQKYRFQYLIGWCNEPIDIDEIIKVLAIIMCHDCTGCCNAVKYINISPYGIIAKSNTGQTYHS